MIHFIGNAQFQFGRGKDKTKRKSRVSPLVGAGLGTVAGGPVGTIAGGLIAKSINKERDRFDREGARTHLGKVANDARVGAKAVGIGSAITAGLAGAALGSQLPTSRKKGFLGLSRDKKAEARDKFKNTLVGAGLGVLGGGVTGAINGAGTGALVGAGRGFVQENKTKKKNKGKFNKYINVAEFAFELPKKQKQKSQLGIIGNDTKVGAKIGAGLGAAYLGSIGASKGLKTPGSLKSKLAMAALGTGIGTLSGGVGGGIQGAKTGAVVGVGRALLTPRKKKTFADRFRK